MPGDAVAALLNVANWRFLVHGTSYADLFAAPSPLNHFWSLAIEEQFYLLFPLVVWLLLKLPGRLRVGDRAGRSAALEWSAHATSTAGSFNRFYYGTDARMASCWSASSWRWRLLLARLGAAPGRCASASPSRCWPPPAGRHRRSAR